MNLNVVRKFGDIIAVQLFVRVYVGPASIDSLREANQPPIEADKGRVLRFDELWLGGVNVPEFGFLAIVLFVEIV